MLSKTIRSAAASGKSNEFDLETWAHEARKLEGEIAELEASRASWVRTQYENRLQFVEAENAELREKLAQRPGNTYFKSPAQMEALEAADKEVLGD